MVIIDIHTPLEPLNKGTMLHRLKYFELCSIKFSNNTVMILWSDCRQVWIGNRIYCILIHTTRGYK
jgi:hypothetical protein